MAARTTTNAEGKPKGHRTKKPVFGARERVVDVSERIAITKLRAQLLKLVVRVAKSGKAVIVTKRGVPLVRVEPFVKVSSRGKRFGCMRDVTEIVGTEEQLFSTGDRWNVE